MYTCIYKTRVNSYEIYVPQMTTKRVFFLMLLIITEYDLTTYFNTSTTTGTTSETEPTIRSLVRYVTSGFSRVSIAQF